VKFDIHEDIAAPAEFVFRRLTDFARHERKALRQGAQVKRVDGGSDIGKGTAWDLSFDYRGKPRQMHAEIIEWTPPERFRVSAISAGLDSLSVIDVVALSRTHTRVNVAIELLPKTLTAKLLVQSLKLARSSVTGRLQGRLKDMATEIETARAKPK
jgi:uncharacterized protein YndB with AHSA1/START domain